MPAKKFPSPGRVTPQFLCGFGVIFLGRGLCATHGELSNHTKHHENVVSDPSWIVSISVPT